MPLAARREAARDPSVRYVDGCHSRTLAERTVLCLTTRPRPSLRVIRRDPAAGLRRPGQLGIAHSAGGHDGSGRYASRYSRSTVIPTNARSGSLTYRRYVTQAAGSSRNSTGSSSIDSRCTTTRIGSTSDLVVAAAIGRSTSWCRLCQASWATSCLSRPWSLCLRAKV